MTPQHVWIPEIFKFTPTNKPPSKYYTQSIQMKQTQKNFFTLLFAVLCLSGLQAEEHIPQKGELPILAWYSVPDSSCTLARYQELRNAGFTATFPHLETMQEVDRALAMCKKTHLKLLASCKDIMNKTPEAVKHLKNQPNLLAYFLRDEPVCNQFAELGSKVKEIQTLDPKHSCYINLLPECGADRMGAPYPEYVERGIKELGTKIVSFDIYPIHQNGVADSWYWQLDIVSSAARKANLPFWAFALLCTHGDYPTPTLASLRLQLYADLAYGAQCLQYFTYWNPIDVTYDFRLAPIDINGKRTFVYDLVQQMNKEIQQVAGVFIGAKVQSVRHLGDRLPSRVMRLYNLPNHFRVIDTHGAHALVSQLTNDGRHYVIIQNCELQTPMTLTVSTSNAVKRVLKNGSIINGDIYANTTRVEPGDIQIYTY